MKTPGASSIEVIIDQDKNIGASFIETSALEGFIVTHDVVYAKPGVKVLKYDVFLSQRSKEPPYCSNHPWWRMECELRGCHAWACP